MKVITDFEDIPLERRTAVALGFFDGVHLGHRAVLAAAAGNSSGFIPAVFTFYEQPRRFFGAKDMLLTSPGERFALFEKAGIELTFAAHFGPFAEMPSGEFEDFLKTSLKAGMAAFGTDYRYGAGAAGSAASLSEYCEKNGMGSAVIGKVTAGGAEVSSSAIRRLLLAGDAAGAAVMLGRPYTITGKVVSGRGLGHRLGFATVNQLLGGRPVKRGVYYSECEVDGKLYRAVTNAGARPTVLCDTEAAETHIIGYEGDLYGKEISVALVKYLRECRKFPDTGALSRQIAKDVETALSLPLRPL